MKKPVYYVILALLVGVFLLPPTRWAATIWKIPQR